MKRWLVIVVGGALTLICMALYYLDLNLVKRLEKGFYDMHMQRFNTAERSGRIAIIDIDEKSLKEFGQWPWPRDQLAGLTKQVIDAGARVVAFDIVFAEADRTSPKALIEILEGRAGTLARIPGMPDEVLDNDYIFAQVLKTGRVVLGCYMHPAAGVLAELPEAPFYGNSILTINRADHSEIYSHLIQSRDMTVPIPMLGEAAGSMAFFNSFPDFDNVIRKTPLIWAYGDRRIYPSLALESLRLYKDVPQVKVEFDGLGISRVHIGDLSVSTDSNAQVYTNYRTIRGHRAGSRFSFNPNFSAADVLSGKVSMDQFKDRIVFVGSSAPGLRDIRATPLSQDYSGVEIQATLVDNILSGDYLVNPVWLERIDIFLIPLVCIFLTLMIDRGKAGLSFGITAVVVLSALATSIYMFRYSGMIYTPAWLVVCVLIMYPTLTMLRFWQKERSERFIRDAFGGMVSLEVVEYIEEDPSRMSARAQGKRVEATMMFVDLRGFTSIAEQMEPEHVGNLLNRYLSPMSYIIRDEYQGHIDKYLGDMIMAEWGTPRPEPDHAIKACQAGLAMREKLDEIRGGLVKQFGHALFFRMGINTGPVTAGFMGSEMQSEFTVIGDAVNLAARLEPMGKEYGCDILIGGNTHQYIGEHFVTRCLDRVTVRGKEEPTRIHELIGRVGEVPETVLEMVQAYEEALEHYWEGNMLTAHQKLIRVLELKPEDVPATRLIDRLALPDDDGMALVASRMRNEGMTTHVGL